MLRFRVGISAGFSLLRAGVGETAGEVAHPRGNGRSTHPSVRRDENLESICMGRDRRRREREIAVSSLVVAQAWRSVYERKAPRVPMAALRRRAERYSPHRGAQPAQHPQPRRSLPDQLRADARALVRAAAGAGRADLAGWIARKEFRRRSLDPELVYTIAVWAVPMGLVGARLYHVATDWDALPQRLSARCPAIWNGGLSIFGRGAGRHAGRLDRLPPRAHGFWVVADCVAPGIVLAQALGRFGNYFNQELYGKPSDLPWAVKIDARTAALRAGHRPSTRPSCTSRSGT